MQSSEQMEIERQKEDDSIEVSYTLLGACSQRHASDILQKVVAAINVQLTLENGQALPFVSPNDFDNLKSQEKLFIYAPSGSGKSRCIYEILKDKLNDTENIFIINPRQSIGDESGRISIDELVNRLNQKDVVVWDNFPDDLLKRDVENGTKALEIISVKDIMSLLVALKPKYMELYRGVTSKIPELYHFELAYDKERVKSIIASYGKNIIQFIDVYEKYILPNIHQVSTLLWQKEPLPITILAYYRELIAKSEKKGRSLDAILEAGKLMRRTEYYNHQFSLIASLEDRQSDIEFLYILKLCYELSLNRSSVLICQLQKEIFDSTPPKEPSRKLSTWIYLSGQYYAMHDAPGEAIQFSKYIKLKIISYLVQNFIKIIPSEDNRIYSFGIFFGRNIDLIASNPLLYQGPNHETVQKLLKKFGAKMEDIAKKFGQFNVDPIIVDELLQDDFLPVHIFEYMKSKRYFEAGLGLGAGEIFPSLGYPLQEQILRQVESHGEFARSLGYGLGFSFLALDKERQSHILQVIIRKSIPFARGLGESLGRNFTSMPQELKEEILKAFLVKGNFQFTRGLGMGLGFTFLQLDKEVQKKIFDFATQSFQFAIGLGYGIGNNFPSLPNEFQREIFELAEKNGHLTRGLGIGLGNIFTSLTKEFQREIFELAEKNIQFAYGLGYQIGYNFNLMKKEQQKEVFVKIDKNSEFASGTSLGLGIAFTYLPRELQENLFIVTEENIQFAYGLGYGFGFIFKYLPERLCLDFFTRIEHNSEFAKGLGYGLGYIFSFLDNSFQNDIFAKIEENGQFAYGVGQGVGQIYEDMAPNLQREVFKRAEENSQFARGLGDGLGFVFTFNNEKLQNDIFSLTEGNPEFAIGLGIGLRYSFAYLSTEFQEKICDKADQNLQFAYGLGLGLGCVIVYLKESIKNNLFSIAERNSKFAVGIGVGLGNLLPFIDENFREQIFKRVEENSQLARGLGIGLGKVFPFLDKEFQSKLFAYAQKNLEFAIGLGEGFGHIFIYLKKELRSKILEDLGRQSSNENDETSGIQDIDNNNRRNGDGFSRGLGIGLGENFPYVRKNLEFRIFAKAAINSQFAIGLGEGFGHILSYVDSELQNRILRKSNEKTLARGLGIGLSDVLYYFNDNEELQNRVFREIDTNKVLAQSLGSCLNLSRLKHCNILEKILTLVERNSEFAEGIRMNEDFRNDIKLLNKESQDRIIDVCNHLEERCSYNKNKFSFNDYPTIGFPSNAYYYYCTNKKNEFDDQNVIDDEMKEYLQMVLDERNKKQRKPSVLPQK